MSQLPIFVCLLCVFSILTASASDMRQVLRRPRIQPVSYLDYPFSNVEFAVGKDSADKAIFHVFSVEKVDGILKLKMQIKEILKSEKEKKKTAKEGQKKSESSLSKGMLMGLEKIVDLCEGIENSKLSWADQLENKAAILELVYSYNSNYLRPLPLKVDVSEFPTFLTRWGALGHLPATNLIYTAGKASHEVDPPDSSFWKKPDNVEDQDLYFGFGRTQMPNFEKLSCKYKEPKKGFGTRGGFVVSCDDKQEYKVKWGIETHVEPVNSRIFHALGFNVSLVDSFPRLKINYDRRIFSEYNLRKPMVAKVTIFESLKLLNFRAGAAYLDPFHNVESVQLKNGTVLKGSDLRAQLLLDPSDKGEQNEKNFREDFEKQIDFVTMISGNAEARDERFYNVGGWGWSELGFTNDGRSLTGSSLGHQNRREVRGAAFLDAWLGSNDIRWDNNRLRLVKQPDGSLVLKHYFSDTGSGLGRSTNLVMSRGTSGNANLFRWAFTVGPNCRATDLTAIERCKQNGWAIEGFQPLDRNDTFEAMTIDDARWMGRWIAKLTKQQIQSALVAAVFSQAEVDLYTQKLLFRRDRFVSDLGLKSISQLRTYEGDIYTPSRDYTHDPLVVRLQDGREITPPLKGCSLKQGKVVCPDGVVWNGK